MIKNADSVKAFLIILIPVLSLCFLVGCDHSHVIHPHPDNVDDLETVNNSFYKTATNLFEKSKISQSVEFKVYGEDEYCDGFVCLLCSRYRTILISRGCLINKQRFEVLIAHELGHINFMDGDQLKADIFALKILGHDAKNYVINYLKDWGRDDSHIEMVLAGYNHWIIENKPALDIVSRSRSELCKDLLRSPLVKKKDTRFIMSSNDNVIGAFVYPGASGIAGPVFIDPSILDNPHFESFIAHELGHIEENTRDHRIADKFAEKLIGKNKILSWLNDYWGHPDVPERIANLSD